MLQASKSPDSSSYPKALAVEWEAPPTPRQCVTILSRKLLSVLYKLVYEYIAISSCASCKRMIVFRTRCIPIYIFIANVIYTTKFFLKKEKCITRSPFCLFSSGFKPLSNIFENILASLKLLSIVSDYVSVLTWLIMIDRAFKV